MAGRGRPDDPNDRTLHRRATPRRKGTRERTPAPGVRDQVGAATPPVGAWRRWRPATAGDRWQAASRAPVGAARGRGWSAQVGGVDRRLEALLVGLARVGGTADDVDLR